MSGEFALIRSLFAGHGGPAHAGSRLGIGDDASLHCLREGMELAVSTDTSVAGIHWPLDLPLAIAGERAVCAALSDLAAMGASPVAAWLNVMATDAAAVEGLGHGATTALSQYRVELAGGDTCRSPVNALSVTVAGELPQGSAMRRDGACDGDRLWLAGRVGFHALGLKQWMAGEKGGEFVTCFQRIEPLLGIGMQLRQEGVRCCIDVSDGLIQDAGHVADASELAIDIDIEAIPDWAMLCDRVGEDAAMKLAAAGGEDYALLFTVPGAMHFPESLAVPIGRCQRGRGVSMRLHGEAVQPGKGGFDHFG
jgi:thiamine-monophosphate kinase